MDTTVSRQRGNDPGPTARTVAHNIARIRLARQLTQQNLSERLTETGRPIPTSSVGKLEAGLRTVDIDDLMALAVALEVSPLGLLLPVEPAAEDCVDVTGWKTSAEALWTWVTGLDREDPPGTAMPVWLQLNPTMHVISQRALAQRKTWEATDG